MTDAERIKELVLLVKKYEEDGVAKLYYSLNRKAWEMADLMNNTDLKTIEMDDPKSKKFDRLKVIWQDAASIASAVKALGEVAGVTGDEEKDVINKRKVTTPESISDVLGNSAGQRN
ncbi:MAG TPA: hypothetical protein VIY47_14925 [Ignavibacteriaceae bacterium]